MKQIFKKLGEFRAGLTRVDRGEPLAGVSLAVIVLLDLFVLSMIFSGLASHTDQLTSPDEYMPRVARSAFIERNWSGIDRIAQLEQLLLIDYNNYSFTARKVLDDDRIGKMHPKSREFFAVIQAIDQDKELKDAFILRQSNVRELHRFKRDFEEVKPVYDTRLLEEAADKDTSKTDLQSVQGRAQVRSAEYDNLHNQLSALDTQINRHPLVQALWKVLIPVNSGERAALIRDIKIYELKYKFIELIWQMLFLLPILTVVYIWHTKAVKKNHPIQILIASHLLVVASIPVVGKLLDVIIDLIPKYFFKRLFELLERLHIVAFWHYLVIIASVAAALLIIYIIQKKLFNPEKIRLQRLERGQCFKCAKKLPNLQCRACPYCGENLLSTCASCKQETPVAGKYCLNCAAPNAIPKQ